MNDADIKTVLAYGFQIEAFIKGITAGFNLFSIPGDVIGLIKLIVDAGSALASAPGALAQWASLSDADAQDLEAFVVANYGSTPDAVDSDIEGVLNFMIALHSVIGWVLQKLDPALLPVKK